MKKIILILLTLVMCLSLVACGNNQKDSPQTEKTTSTQTTPDIKLTLDNYSTYLNVSVTPNFPGKVSGYYTMSDSKYHISNTKAGCILTVEGVSGNYDYNNVVITVKVYGSYAWLTDNAGPNDDIHFSEEITVSCNIAGEGAKQIILFDGENISSYVKNETFNCLWEIVSVSGTVIRV